MTSHAEMRAKLDEFCVDHNARSKGSLAVLVQLTRAFSKDTPPIDPSKYVTDKQGQVAGMGEGNLEKCKSNLAHGLNPVIIIILDCVVTARNLLEDAGIDGRVEVWDLQQFLSINVYEHGFFSSEDRRRFLTELISGYNGIINECETDPSLHIEYVAR